MSVALATFPAAPLDRMARIFTRSFWPLLCALVLIGSLYIAAGGPWAGAVPLGVAVLGAAFGWYVRRRMPVAYVVEDVRFTVRRRKASPRSFAGTSSRARRGRLRVVGLGSVVRSGGSYGYLGRYRADGRTVQAFVTDRDRVVLLDVGDVAVAVSPNDPDAFLAEVARAA